MIRRLMRTTTDWRRIVSDLRMQPHPTERGYMSPIIYDSPHPTTSTGLSACNMVQFLFESGNYSPWHRMRHPSDELWIHQAGRIHAGQCHLFSHVSNLDQVHMINAGHYSSMQFAPMNTLIMRADTWYAAVVEPNVDYCLYAEVVTPGFVVENCEFADASLIDSLDNIDDQLKAQLRTYLAVDK